MIDPTKLSKAKELFSKATRPLFFFDDDSDGTCSFLILRHLKEDGKGIIIKAAPYLKAEYAQKVTEYAPDLVVILDIANVDQDFVDEVKVPIIWIDHHGFSQVSASNLYYLNPKQDGSQDSQPTSYWAYQFAREDQKNDTLLWLGTLGSVADWYVPSFADEFMQKFPAYLPAMMPIGDILYTTKIGKLWRLLSFVLKGTNKDLQAANNILNRLRHPDELMEGLTSQGKLLLKRYQKLEQQYLSLLDSALHHVTEDMVLFESPSAETSFTSDLSNELMYRFPDKLIMVCRKKNGEFKMSLRSYKVDLNKAVEAALV